MDPTDRPAADGPVQTRGKADRQRYIVGSAPFTVPATLAVVAAAWFFLPVRLSAPDPFTLAATWSFVAMLPYALVCMVIATDRLLEGSHDPLAGGETSSLKIHCRVMQNHLEQLVWFALCVFPLSALLRPEQAHLVPIVAVCFVFARLIYWRGYFVNGTLGRKYGVQVSFTLNIGLMLLTGVLLLFR